MPNHSDKLKIKVKNISKSFIERRRLSRSLDDERHRGERVLVLSDISFDVYEGEMIMILGHSGCGKSTLLNIVSGFDKPDRGNVFIDGEKVEKPNPRRMFIFQQSSLFPWMTVRKNIQLGIKGEDEEILNEKTDEYMRMVGLENFRDYYPYQISGGMSRLAELARALAMDPDVLYMDEPFSALDFMTRCLMREELLNLMQIFKKTILFITHDIDEAIQLGDKVLVLSDTPAVIKKTFDLTEHKHPRDIINGEVGKIRRKAYLEMGVNPVL